MEAANLPASGEPEEHPSESEIRWWKQYFAQKASSTKRGLVVSASPPPAWKEEPAKDCVCPSNHWWRKPFAEGGSRLAPAPRDWAVDNEPDIPPSY